MPFSFFLCVLISEGYLRLLLLNVTWFLLISKTSAIITRPCCLLKITLQHFVFCCNRDCLPVQLWFLAGTPKPFYDVSKITASLDSPAMWWWINYSIVVVLRVSSSFEFSSTTKAQNVDIVIWRLKLGYRYFLYLLSRVTKFAGLDRSAVLGEVSHVVHILIFVVYSTIITLWVVWIVARNFM